MSKPVSFIKVDLSENERNICIFINVASIQTFEPDLGSTVIKLTDGEVIITTTDCDTVATLISNVANT